MPTQVAKQVCRDSMRNSSQNTVQDAPRRSDHKNVRSDSVAERDEKFRREPQAAHEFEGEAPLLELENGLQVYQDELDVISLLDSHPSQALTSSHALDLWKKIGAIPKERRHRLVDVLLSRQVTKIWQITKLKYDDPDLFDQNAEDLISTPVLENPGETIVWEGVLTRTPWYYAPFTRFQKIFFSVKGKVYGRLSTGGFLLGNAQDIVAPSYFEIRKADKVKPTNEPCELSLLYGDGQLHLQGLVPQGFPEPGRHVPPLNDNACDYMRAAGPGVVVGQGWVEGRDLEQTPRLTFGEYLLVRKF